MKKNNIIPALVIGFALMGSTALAETSDVLVPTPPTATSVVASSENGDKVTTNNLAKIQALGAKRIAERVTALSKLKASISSSKLTDTEKTAINAEVDAQIGALTNLGTQISGSTDVNAAKALVNSIFSDYRVIAVFMPKIQLEKRVDEMQNHVAVLNDTFTKVQAKIDAAKTKGTNVILWQTNLDSAKTLLTADVSKLSDLSTQVSNMKPADYPAVSKASVKAINAGIKAVYDDFSKIGKMIRKPMAIKEKINSTPKTTTTAPASNGNQQ